MRRCLALSGVMCLSVPSSAGDVEPPVGEQPSGVFTFAEGMRWTGEFGEPISLEYSFVPDGTALFAPDGTPLGPSVLFAELDQQFGEDVTSPDDPRAGFGGRFGTTPFPNMGGWAEVFDNAVENWTLRVGTDFAPVFRGAPDPENPGDDVFVNFWDEGLPWFTEGPYTDPAVGAIGDIRFAMAPIDGPGGIRFLATGSNTQTDDAHAGYVILDADEDWTRVEFTSEFQFLHNQTARAIGISVGLLPACPADARLLMREAPLAGNNRTGLQFNDVRAAQWLYGDRAEPNDTVGTARPAFVTPLDPNSQPVILSNTEYYGPLTINGPTDIDHFFVIANQPGAFYEIRVLTDGGTSSVSAQPSDPALGCADAGTMSAKLHALQDLVVTVFDPSGERFARVDEAHPENGANIFETITFLVQPEQLGRWTIRVEGDGSDEIQRYLVVLRAEGVVANCAGDCDRNGYVDFQDLVSMLFEFGPANFGEICDVDESGVVDFGDLVQGMLSFGPCAFP